VCAFRCLQDTNALCFTTAVACIGYSAREKLEVNSVCVPRMAGEAVGAIARLEKADGTGITCNVEYNQLAPLLKATLGTGDVNDASGYSPFPGNINQLIMSIPEYAAVLERTKGASELDPMVWQLRVTRFP
jgi:UDP-sugar pyrophosphorylase